MSRMFKKTFLILMLVIPFAHLAAQSADEAFADRLLNIDKLINRSSGARQVIDSGNS